MSTTLQATGEMSEQTLGGRVRVYGVALTILTMAMLLVALARNVAVMTL